MRPRYGLLLLTLSILLAGCVSTQKRYERAVRLDGEGRYADAVRYYAKVLDREPGYEDARARLAAAGAAAVDDAYERARAAEGVGDYEAALRALERLEEVRALAAGVGVALAAPDDLDAYREVLEDEAVLALARRGEADEARGRWRDALRAYERAATHYDVTPAMRDELVRSQARVHVRWAEEEFEHGRFRAAFERAEQGVALVGPEALPHALDLQEAAVAAGTRRVAFLPFEMTEAAGRTMPRHVLQDLDRVLTFEHWAAPPLFVESADPAEVHRALRRAESRPGRDEAVAVGRRVEADWVVTGQVLAFEEADEDVRDRVRSARTRGRTPVDTSYVEQSFTRSVAALALVRVVDVRTGGVLYEGEVDAAVREPMRRGVYDGDPRELALSPSERRLFDPEEEHRAVRALEEALVDVLAVRVAERTYDGLLGHIR